MERVSAVDGAVVWARTAEPGETVRVLPDGCMDLLWWGGGLSIAGPDTRGHTVTGERAAAITGLRFGPGLGPRVFGVPAHELRDQRVPLAAVWPESAVRELAERAAAAEAGVPGWGPEYGRVLEIAAAGRLRDAAEQDLALGAVVRRLREGQGVADTAEAVGYSERQLHRRCLTAFGYGPKTLARVLRMRRALRLAEDGRPLSGVAADSGYADQAHLAREIRALAGAPVSELVRR